MKIAFSWHYNRSSSVDFQVLVLARAKSKQNDFVTMGIARFLSIGLHLVSFCTYIDMVIDILFSVYIISYTLI